jgi:ATP-dependent DNA helicase RecG
MNPTLNPSGQQLSLFTADGDVALDVSQLVSQRESQYFERKGNRLDPARLADCMIGLANADGGRIVIGINDGKIEGVEAVPKAQNEWRHVGISLAVPPVRHTVRLLPCTNEKDQPDNLLLIDVEASESIHRTTGGKCFLRVGDRTRQLSSAEERELAFDKGESDFDSTLAAGQELADLDMEPIHAYAKALKSTDTVRFMQARGIYLSKGTKVGVTQAGVLLFGHNTPIWSYIRYQRYDGTTIETGARSNLREDARLMGTIPELIAQAQALLKDEIGNVVRLMPDGRFGRVPTLPEFAWLEAIVNAVTHRSYMMHGDGIHVRQFSDRLEVQSPGRLPGLVRIDNIRDIRYSRNPHIARVLAEMTSYVRESNEGVPRMFTEMQSRGLPEPRYKATDAHVTVTLFKQPTAAVDSQDSDLIPSLSAVRQKLGRRGAGILPLLVSFFANTESASTIEVAAALSVARNTARQYLHIMAENGLVQEQAQTATDPRAKWARLPAFDWNQVSDMLAFEQK